MINHIASRIANEHKEDQEAMVLGELLERINADGVDETEIKDTVLNIFDNLFGTDFSTQTPFFTNIEDLSLDNFAHELAHTVSNQDFFTPKGREISIMADAMSEYIAGTWGAVTQTDDPLFMDIGQYVPFANGGTCSHEEIGNALKWMEKDAAKRTHPFEKIIKSLIEIVREYYELNRPVESDEVYRDFTKIVNYRTVDRAISAERRKEWNHFIRLIEDTFYDS